MKAELGLTGRDLEVLEWVGCCGGDLLGSIAARYWPACKPDTADNRLMRLVAEGYLSAKRDERDVTKIFFLTEKGAKSLPGVSRLHLQIGAGPDVTREQSRMLPATISAIEGRARQEGGELVYWRTEREVRALLVRARGNEEYDEESVPDGQAVIRRADGGLRELNIEIDGEYYGRRLDSKLERVASNRQATLWCCTSKRAGYLAKRLAPYSHTELVVLGGS